VKSPEGVVMKTLIHGVKVKKLSVHPDERGRLMEILRKDDELFATFGQVYMTSAYPGVVKAWHYHKKQVDHFTSVHGMVKLVLYDPRKGSPTRGQVNEFFIGAHSPVLVRIPAGVYHGFKGIDVHESIMINIPTEVYRYDRPDEYRLPAHTKKIPYDWARKDG
jgi:dTDP-4-dehydrorhamnose 3,5-epimerase